MGEGFAFFIAETATADDGCIYSVEQTGGRERQRQGDCSHYGLGKNKKPQGEVLQVLDEADENDRVMKEILLENGFAIVFPEKVLEESAASAGNHTGR